MLTSPPPASARTRQSESPAADGRQRSRRLIQVRPPLEVADIFRIHGPAWRAANAGHVSLAQLKVMSAIETCRTAALGGHIEGCEDCGHRRDRVQPAAATAIVPSVRGQRRVTSRGRGRRLATRRASAMPLLRRPYGHHRDLPACGSGTRATIVTSRHRDHGVMIQHDEPQPPAEAMALQPAVRHAPASITNALTATMTAGSRCPSTSRGTIVALADRDHHRAAPLNRLAQSPRRLNRSTRILKSP